MRILIDLTSLADNFSGIERFAACLALEMIREKRNHYILLFKEDVHPLFADRISQPNIETVVLPRCGKLLFNQLRLPLAIYKCRADRYLFLAFPVPVLLFRKNMISTIHDLCCWDCPDTMNHVSALYFRISHRVAMCKCKRLITISEFSKSRILSRFSLGPRKLYLTYCGVDERFLDPPDSEDADIRQRYRLPDRYILSLSTLEPRKNLSLLIRAYSRLVLEDGWDIPLVLAGRRGWKMDDLLSGVPEAVTGQIHFTGFIADGDLPWVYAHAELFVFPSLYEGFGLPPLEALACGTRVLSSDAASLPEVLGDAADYFESNNLHDLYEALKNAGRSQRATAACQGRLQASRFSWRGEAESLLEKIENLS